MNTATLSAAALLIAFSTALAPAMAQTDPGKRVIPGVTFTPLNPSIEAMNTAMAKLNDGTSKALTGDADHNFIARMMPIHQAAIDLAEAEMKFGADAKLKQQAARIIAAQQHEITTMQAWLDKHPASPPVKPNVPSNIQWK
jgi:hypothetical protein